MAAFARSSTVVPHGHRHVVNRALVRFVLSVLPALLVFREGRDDRLRPCFDRRAYFVLGRPSPRARAREEKSELHTQIRRTENRKRVNLPQQVTAAIPPKSQRDIHDSTPQTGHVISNTVHTACT